ncbi:hypothetical protein QBC42DRAFT_273709 [Cladorrhinum samala]|uniref:Microsomal glutathione S-transferase 3 n=1 Tax=Cladorrhinum samala TaxID=585594 RepID=A0AAV9HFW0_9PEZI|nr:hypothetical protein QBC42DRAFT_273709 [Cladorrhinum samala]
MSFTTTSPITLPAEYGYVLTAASSTFFVNFLHFILTARARKASGIQYPTSFASAEQAEKDPKAFKFNCAQRAHANFTENLTPFLGGLLITGLKYPVFAGAAGLAWSVGRASYAVGYSTRGPKGRILGFSISSIVDFVLKLTAAYTAVGYALGW